MKGKDTLRGCLFYFLTKSGKAMYLFLSVVCIKRNVVLYLGFVYKGCTRKEIFTSYVYINEKEKRRNMGKSLIITEKPSVAQEFAKVLHVNGRKDGYIENAEYVITWCVGHLVGLVYPESYDEKYKKWRLEDLPFLPQTYKYGVVENVRKQYDIVHEMLMRKDISRVYWAGDAGKEGQTIEENIRNFGGVREGMEEFRVWIDSQTEEEILRGIREAKPMSEYANLGNSGIMRTIEDYAMGINFSRVMSVKYGNLLNDTAGTKSYTAIAVGRVMTCVLGMVVNREREIRNFEETSFFRVVGKFVPFASDKNGDNQENVI